jgi:hypothetical protein
MTAHDLLPAVDLAARLSLEELVGLNDFAVAELRSAEGLDLLAAAELILLVAEELGRRDGMAETVATDEGVLACWEAI